MSARRSDSSPGDLASDAACRICREGPRHVAAELVASWASVPPEAPLPGYVCLVAKRHVVEPFQLPLDERIAFWEDVNTLAAALVSELRPLKLNYEIHGNTLPHLHLHLYPRTSGDRFEGRPIDGRDTVTRTAGELDAVRRAIEAARDWAQT